MTNWNLGYLSIDLLAVVPLTFTMTLSKPRKDLGPKRPTSSLLGMQTVSSVLFFLFVSTISILLNLKIIASDKDYVRWPSQNANMAAWWFLSDNWESSTL